MHSFCFHSFGNYDAQNLLLILTHIPCDKCRALVGSKSDFVLHNATCSVAIVRHSEDALEVHDPLVSSGGVRKIVIAVDESKEVNCTLTAFLALQ
jgi:hypothetical protein